jgi:hypothetical protein
MALRQLPAGPGRRHPHPPPAEAGVGTRLRNDAGDTNRKYMSINNADKLSRT